ncbi:hypothetical protein D9V30_00215 [Mycetocola reblochoni]|uniref:Uncharacterized protein n=1 Tax=Mycetocola reblochoni TaxID=331618 RepID=A0A3L6ZTC3_9MICO|nr:hypothetical protein D9V30_00215 [Mycetocola reblochoni]
MNAHTPVVVVPLRVRMKSAAIVMSARENTESRQFALLACWCLVLSAPLRVGSKMTASVRTARICAAADAASGVIVTRSI